MTSFGQSRPDEKRLSYSAYNKPLKTALKELSRLSGVNIVFSESRIPGEKNIQITANNEKLGSIITVLIDDFELDYQIVGDQLVLVKKTVFKNKEHTIYGYIRDKNSGEALIGANVFLVDKSKGTTSNDQGFYSFTLPQNSQRIQFSYLGYKPGFSDIYLGEDNEMDIYLEPDGYLNEIIILDNILDEEHENTATQQNLHIDKIQAGNHLAGEADLFRYLGNQAGITTAADGIGGLNIRGGSVDQNLVLLDGVPIYNTGHALGIFSIFNSNTIKSASIYKGGIPARYSGRLSSVIDVHTKDGNDKRWGGEFTISTIALKGSLEGPIIKDKVSLIMSFRRTFMDVWVKELTKYQYRENSKEGQANYYFYDLNAKLNFKLNKKTSLVLSAFHSKDSYQNSTYILPSTNTIDINDQSLLWGNKLYYGKLSRQLSKNMFAKVLVYMTDYSLDSYHKQAFAPTLDTLVTFDASLFTTKVVEKAVKTDFDWHPNLRNSIKFGASYLIREFAPQIASTSNNIQDNLGYLLTIDDLRESTSVANVNGNELNIYVEDEINLGEGTSINVGLNYGSILTQSKKNYSTFQPRLAFLAGSENLYFKLGVTRMQQYLHLLTNSGLGLPSDVWLPTDDDLPPQKSWIFNTSFGYKSVEGYKFGVDVYYKKFDDLSAFKEGGSIDINGEIDWQSQIPIGKGNAYGIETFIEKASGSTLFALNYSYSISDRTFNDLNNGIKFPFTHNRRHSIKASVTFRLSAFSELLINWSYMTGTYFSRPLTFIAPVDGKPQIIYPEKNNAIFPNYHRIDIGFSFYNTYKWGNTKLFLGVYNAYNRKNPFYNELYRNMVDNTYEIKQYSLLPLLPTISYSISF